MKKIKLILMLAIIMLMVVAFASCGEKTLEPDTNTNTTTTEVTNDIIVDPQTGAYIEVGSGLKTMYLAKDVHGNVCTHVLYNTLTNEYWIYDFEYIYDWNTEGYVFNRAYLTITDIINEDEIITSDKNKIECNCSPNVTVNCPHNDNNMTNNPETSHPTIENPHWSKTNPKNHIIYYDDYFKLTLKDIIYTNYGTIDIKVEFENNSNHDIFVMCDSACLDGYTIHLDYGDSIIAGTKAVDVMTIYSSTLQDCEISDPKDLTFSIQVSNDDGTYDLLSKGIDLYLNIKN